MAAANLKPNLLKTLESDVETVEIGGAEEIFLTPYLALACSLLYMMAADGELESQESSHLQSVLGGDKAVLSYALRYVQSVPIEQFFISACEVLSVKDRWCILTNVCDALLSDGHADRTELALFTQMTTAFGIQKTQFDPYFHILAIKNDKTVLGKYEGVREERQPMTSHFALAISLLYMLTADGSIGAQEVGQLESVIGEFDGLQNVALKYVRSVKLKQFLDEASALLKTDQKIYILTNVCDSMMSDGEIARLEDKLFLSMLTAFGFTEKTFASYAKVLETKNFKPFDTSTFKNHVRHDRLTGAEQEGGITFQNALSDVDETISNSAAEAANQGVWVGATHDSKMSQFIARTMDDNIQSVSDDFENQSNVVKVSLNATADLNLQKLGDSSVANNRQTINDDGLDDNLQKIETLNQTANLQQIGVSAELGNRQAIDDDGFDDNLQKIEALNQTANLQQIGVSAELGNRQLTNDDGFNDSLKKIETPNQIANSQQIEVSEEPSNRQLIDLIQANKNLQAIDAEMSGAYRATIPQEIRVQNIHEIAEEVHNRLNRFEAANSHFLQIGRAEKFTDEFVLLKNEPLDVNRQLINASFARMGIAFSGAAAQDDVDASNVNFAKPTLKGKSIAEDSVAVAASTALQKDKVLIEPSFLHKERSRRKTWREAQLWRDAGLWRGRGFVYVQLIVAAFTVAFAAPIETRVVLGRSMSGPLVVLPVLTPEFIEQRNLSEPELPLVQEHGP